MMGTGNVQEKSAEELMVLWLALTTAVVAAISIEIEALKLAVAQELREQEAREQRS